MRGGWLWRGKVACEIIPSFLLLQTPPCCSHPSRTPVGHRQLMDLGASAAKPSQERGGGVGIGGRNSAG